MSIPHPSQLDWNEIENKMKGTNNMATYIDGMDGGKHDSDNIEVSLSPIYTKIENPSWGTTFVRKIDRRQAINLLREWNENIFDPYEMGVYDMLEYYLDLLENGIKGWVDWTNEELAQELNTMNLDADWRYESEEDENGDECPVIYEVIGN